MSALETSGHGKCTVYDLEVMGLNPVQVELGKRITSVIVWRLLGYICMHSCVVLSMEGTSSGQGIIV